MSEIIIYEDPDITKPVQVTLEGETVWLDSRADGYTLLAKKFCYH